MRVPGKLSSGEHSGCREAEQGAWRGGITNEEPKKLDKNEAGMKGEHPGNMSFMLIKLYVFWGGSGSQLFVFHHNVHNTFRQNMLSMI